MRGALPDLASPHPLVETLPALYREDAFAQGLCLGLDASVAPLLSVLDNYPAYLDLATTPEDMLAWMAHWLGFEITSDLPVARQRELLQVASATHGWQGTPRGMQLAIEVVFGISVRVQDSGGATWSSEPLAQIPGRPVSEVVIVIEQGTVSEKEIETINAFVETLKPAHVRHRLEVA
ncbi:MAG: phage tail protein [Ornithinimicrobium sp.]